MDRTQQYQPLIQQIATLEKLAADADSARAAVDANLAKANGLQKQFNILQQKTQPWGGGTPEDFAAFGQVWAQLNAANNATEGLMVTASAKVLAFRNAYTVGFGLFQNLLQDPGAQEIV